MNKYTNKEMVWITAYFILCMAVGYFLAKRFPIQDEGTSKQLMIDADSIKLCLSGSIAFVLFFLGGFINGRLNRNR